MRALIISVIAALGLATPAWAAGIEDFYGIYVGIAVDSNADGTETGERHIDMIVTPFGDGGLSLEVISVRLVDGRRDLPGVRRRVLNATFAPQSGGNILLAKEPFDPFEERKEAAVLAGDPMQWAYIEDDSLFVNTLIVLDDGKYESEVYERRLTGDGGMIISYERFYDGKIARRVEGKLVRAK